MYHCTLCNWQCKGAPNHYTNVTTRNTIYRSTELHNLTQHTQIIQIEWLQLQLHNTQNQNLITRKWIPCAVAQCCAVTTLTTLDTDRYTQIQNLITRKRIPCASAQRCAVTTLTTSDTEKCKNVTRYSDSLLLRIFTSGTSYSEFH